MVAWIVVCVRRLLRTAIDVSAAYAPSEEASGLHLYDIEEGEQRLWGARMVLGISRGQACSIGGRSYQTKASTAEISFAISKDPVTSDIFY